MNNENNNFQKSWLQLMGWQLYGLTTFCAFTLIANTIGFTSFIICILAIIFYGYHLATKTNENKTNWDVYIEQQKTNKMVSPRTLPSGTGNPQRSLEQKS